VPIYTYECQSCSSSLEKRQSFNDAPLTIHDGCGGSLRRVIHPAGIVFKGSGFYNTDYKNGTGAKRAESEPAKAESTKSDSAASESSSSAAGSTNGSASAGQASSAKRESKGESKSTPAAATP
jgi:putative FmdB family regulatory protein